MVSLLMSLGGLIFCLFWGEIFFFFCLIMMMMMFMISELSVKSVYFLGELESLSGALILLSIWIVLLAMMGSVKVSMKSVSGENFVLIKVFLMIALVFSFYVSDFLLFYIGFESCLIPLFLLILGWGVQPERIEAGFYMVLYTLLGSLPLFFYIMSMGENSGSLSMSSPMLKCSELSVVFSVFMVSAFLIKFPMYGVHLWLLKAHVEAPVAGSMILAGVLLKLGGYGLIRIMLNWPKGLELLNESLIMVSMCGGLIMSLVCLRQMDMKLLIAMSSVVHMSVCISGLFVFFGWAYKGVLLVMLGHGLCSSGLFYLANISYDRTGSRSMLVNKGLLNFLPGIGMWWFLLLVMNMSGPPSINLLGEIFLVISLVSWSKMVMVVLAMMSFFSACYNLFLFSKSQHGQYLSSKTGFSSGQVVEHLVLLLHWAPMNLLIISIFYMV